MSFTAQDYIDEIQRLAFDKPLSKLVKGDACTAQLQPGTPTRTKTQFTLANRNIVDPAGGSGAVFQADADNAGYATATLSDAVTGLGSVSSAPQKSISFMYYFQFFTSAEVTGLRNNGLRQLGISPTVTESWTEIAETLFDVVCYYAAAEALRINAAAYVKYYDISIGAGKSFSLSQKFANVAKMAQVYEDKAIQLSDYFYKGQDRQKRPAYASGGPCYPGNRQQPTR